jgi:hypothetical protein
VKLVKGEGRATRARALARLAGAEARRGVSSRDRDRDVIHVGHSCQS